MGNPVTIGTVWKDRGSGEVVEVTAVADDGRVQVSPLNGDGYKVMKIKSLRNNYTAVAKDTNHVDTAPEVSTEPVPAPKTGPMAVTNAPHKEIKAGGRVEMVDGTMQGTIEEVESEFVLRIKWDDGEVGHVHPADVKHIDLQTESTPEPPSPPTESENKGRKAAGRVKMPDGSIIAGSKFITDICGRTREDTYKVDSPIRWLLKQEGQELLKNKNAEIVYGKKVTN